MCDVAIGRYFVKPRLHAVPSSPENFHGDIPEWAYSSVESILASLRAVDPMTFYHCLRVGEYSLRLAKAAGLNEYQQKVAQFAGLLHDVGKMGVEQSIVHKPGKLTSDEYEKMKSHSILSEEIIKPLAHDPFFGHILPAVRGHHERIDGAGYPDKLIGDDIPLISRLILVVDTLDAMAQDRPYRMGLPIDTIYKELKKFAGVQFDRQLVTIFLQVHPAWGRDGNDEATLQRVAPAVKLKAA